MAVYVDFIRKHPTEIKCFSGGSCHMWADTHHELHEMARKIGMKKEWFQFHRLLPHYDLTPSRRNLAMLNDAIEKSTKDGIRDAIKASSTTN